MVWYVLANTNLYSWLVISATSSFNVEVFSVKNNRSYLAVEFLPSKISLAIVHRLKLLARIILFE